MQAIILFVAGCFSWFYIDLNPNRFSSKSRSPQCVMSIEIGKRKEKRKRQRRKYKNRKYKKRKSFIEKTYKFNRTKPKDVRYSNQKKLRKMYING